MNQPTPFPIEERLLQEGAEELYEHGPCGFLSMTPNGTIVSVNQTFLDWTGYAREAVIGEPLQRFLTVPGKIFYDTHYAPLLKMQGFVRELAFDVRCDGGRTLPILLNSTVKTGASGEALLIVTAIFDASDRRRYEQELLKARKDAEEALRIKADLLAMMSHDIRTPASAIVTAVQLMEQMEVSPQQGKALRILKSASTSLINQLNEVLDYSKLEAGRVTLNEKVVDLRSWLQNLMLTLGQAGEDKGLRMVLDIDSALPRRLCFDEVKVGQVLGNLISNAVKFTDQGEIRLAMKLLKTGPQTSVVSFSVADTGIGIPQDRLPYIFDDFVQVSSDTSRQYGGTGLGLAICRKLVALYDSSISVDSVLGKGSTFAFSLHLRDEEARD